MTVNRGRLAVGIRLVLIAVEHLDLVLAHQKHAAVAAILPRASGRRWRRPFDVQLAVAEFISRPNGAFARRDDHGARCDRPAGRVALFSLPFGQIRAVEQHDGVRRRRTRRLLRAERAGRDDGRLRPRAIVDVPFAAGQHRRV